MSLTTAEVRCCSCRTTISVRFDSAKETIADALKKKGWDNTRGAVTCKEHRHVEVMPRHTDGRRR